ncbi:MAG TPA: porin family protein [Burkholderiales bacterium]
MKRAGVLLFLPSVLVSAAAAAQDNGFYLGGSLGQATFTAWCVDDPAVLSCDDKANAWKLLGGYRFSRNIAVEATYINWGEVDGTVRTASGDRRVSAQQTSLGIAGVLSFDVSPQFAVFGKAGFLMTEQDLPASSQPSRDETEFHYGLGARFGFAPDWAVRAEWEKTEKLKVDMISIGVEYRF